MKREKLEHSVDWDQPFAWGDGTRPRISRERHAALRTRGPLPLASVGPSAGPVSVGNGESRVNLAELAAVLNDAVARGRILATFRARDHSPFKIKIDRGDTRTVDRLLSNIRTARAIVARVDVDFLPGARGKALVARSNPRKAWNPNAYLAPGTVGMMPFARGKEFRWDGPEPLPIVRKTTDRDNHYVETKDGSYIAIPSGQGFLLSRSMVETPAWRHSQWNRDPIGAMEASRREDTRTNPAPYGFPSSSVKIRGLAARDFPVFDARDGGEHEQFQGREIPVRNLAWNEHLHRGTTGFDTSREHVHETELLKLIRRARRDGERILYGRLDNYGVGIEVVPGVDRDTLEMDRFDGRA